MFAKPFLPIGILSPPYVAFNKSLNPPSFYSGTWCRRCWMRSQKTKGLQTYWPSLPFWFHSIWIGVWMGFDLNKLTFFKALNHSFTLDFSTMAKILKEFDPVLWIHDISILIHIHRVIRKQVNVQSILISI